VSSLNYEKEKAYKLGLQDARQGRVYRHSVDPGSWLRYFLVDYDKGWKEGRLTRCIK